MAIREWNAVPKGKVFDDRRSHLLFDRLHISSKQHVAEIISEELALATANVKRKIAIHRKFFESSGESSTHGRSTEYGAELDKLIENFKAVGVPDGV